MKGESYGYSPAGRRKQVKGFETAKQLLQILYTCAGLWQYSVTSGGFCKWRDFGASVATQLEQALREGRPSVTYEVSNPGRKPQRYRMNLREWTQRNVRTARERTVRRIAAVSRPSVGDSNGELSLKRGSSTGPFRCCEQPDVAPWRMSRDE